MTTVTWLVGTYDKQGNWRDVAAFPSCRAAQQHAAELNRVSYEFYLVCRA